MIAAITSAADARRLAEQLTFERVGDRWYAVTKSNPKPQEQKTMTDEAQPEPINLRPEEYLAAKMLRAFHDDEYVEALQFAKLLSDAADELRDQFEAGQIRLRAALSQLSGAKDDNASMQEVITGLRKELNAMTDSRETVMQQLRESDKANSVLVEKLNTIIKKNAAAEIQRRSQKNAARRRRRRERARRA